MTLHPLIDALKSQEGLIRTLGLDLQATDDGLHVAMTMQPLHAGAPGIAHGGAVMALLDTALGFRALQISLSQNQLTSTVEMKTNFLRPARVGQRLIVRPELQSHGRSLLVLSGHAEDAQTGERVAFAVGTFNLYDSPKLGSAK